MVRPRFAAIMRVITVILIVTTIAFAGIMGYTLTIPATPATQVPYVGLTLAYVNNKTTDIGTYHLVDCTQTVIYYLSKTASGLFQVEAHEELFTFPLLVNATTREYVQGAEKGAYVGHLVPTNLFVGEVVPIYPNRTFTVLSVNETFELEKGVQVQAFKLYYHQEWMNGDVSYSQTIIRYYDTKYGIMLKELDNDLSTNPAGYGVVAHHFNVTLVDDEDPPIHNGLSNYKALFISHTNPLAADTDHDLWTDSIDPCPNCPLLPNGLILALLAVASALAFIAYRGASRKRPSKSVTRPVS